MDYRIRWQQRRRQRQQKRLLVIPAVFLLGLFVYLLFRLFSAGGEVYWVHDFPGGLITHFEVGPAVIYVTLSDGHVQALQVRTGANLSTGALYSSPEAFNTAPLLHRQDLYLGSDLGLFHCLDAHTGQPLWEFDAQSPIRCRPQISNETVFFGTDAGRVYAFTCDGKKVWTTELDAALSGDPGLSGQMLLVATTRGSLYAINTADGRVLWRQALNAPLYSPVTIADPLVAVGSDTGSLYLREMSTGQPVHEYRTAGLIRTPVASGNNVICFGSTDGWLRVISRDGQQPLWAYDLGGPVTVGPVISGGYIYVGRPGRLFALRVTDGRVQRTWKGEQFAGNLAVAFDMVFVGTTTGRVLALVTP